MMINERREKKRTIIKHRKTCHDTRILNYPGRVYEASRVLIRFVLLR